MRHGPSCSDWFRMAVSRFFWLMNENGQRTSVSTSTWIFSLPPAAPLEASRFGFLGQRRTELMVLLVLAYDLLFQAPKQPF